MTKIAIFDRNVGIFQWLSSQETPIAALIEFDNDVGIYPDKSGDEITETDLADWHFYEITDIMADKLDDWAAKGSPASEFPLEGQATL